MIWYSVDPGVRYYAWAEWVHDRLMGYGLHPITTRLPVGHSLVLEIPRVYREDRRRGNVRNEDIVALARSCGRLEDRAGHVVTYYPSDWKGQLPKKTSHARIKAGLLPDRLVMLSAFPAADREHLLDAIGIGQYHVRQYAHTR